MTIGEFSVNQRVLVNLVFAAVVIVGVYTYFAMPAEILPNVSMDEAVVAVVYPGVSPEEMETLVTKPLEEEIEAVDDVDFVASTSGESRSIIDVRFKPGLSDDEFDRRILDLRAAVDNARSELPDEAEDPQVVPIKLAEVIPIMSVSLGGPVSETILREVAQDLRDQILDVRNVKAVDIVGTRDEEILLELDADRLEQYGLPISRVVGSLATRNINVPGGTVELSNSEYIVRTLGQFEDLADIENHVIASDRFGRQIRVRDVGAVRDTLSERLTLARLNGERSVTLWINKERSGSVVTVANDVRAVIDAYDAALNEDISFEIRNDTSVDVRDVLDILQRNALFGIVLVALTLFFFIGLRNATLAVIGIPFSFFAAFILMNAAGITVNTISLFSLVLVLGMLVDDAIIVIENIYRHMEQGMKARQAAILGTSEVLAPVTAAVLTTVAAFLPMLLMSGTWGKFMSVIPKTVTFALLASLLEAFLILPSHMSDFARVARAQNKCHPQFVTLTRRYERALRRTLRHRYLALLSVFVMAIIAVGLVFTLDITIFEEEDLGQIEVRAQLPVGTRLELTDDVARQLEEIVFALPEDEFEAVVTRVGFMIANYRGQLASNNLQINIDLVDDSERDRSDTEIMDDLRKRMSEIPGLSSLWLSRPQQGPPSGRPVEVRVKGDDPRMLSTIADRLKASLAEYPGVVEVDDDLTPGKSEMRVSVIQDQAALYGLTVADIASAVRVGFEGVEATKYRGGGDDEIDVIVRLEEGDRRNLDDLRDLRVATPYGGAVPIRNVADISIGSAPAELNRRDGDRIVTVTADVEEGTTSTEVNSYLQREFADVSGMYPGYSLDFGGEYQETQESFASLLVAFGVAILLIYLILGTEFQSFIQPFIVMFTVPFAFIGVIIGLVVMRYPFTLNAGVAIVALAGVVVNDSIVLVDFIKRARANGVTRWESVVEAGCMRLRPILLTSITTILGVLPL
ncbi:MAG: efflux RND transporter permease subunit, partial [Candidatus Eisenbacteria bacterium]|nr:efflux RND transporter permease subunit [Candidatus Eisenbacteria bacterium]